MVKISSFAATYSASIMPNSKGRISQLSNLVAGMFAMNGITFFDQGGVSGFCHFAFIVQDWQQSLKWLHEKWKTRKNVLQKLSTNIQGLVESIYYLSRIVQIYGCKYCNLVGWATRTLSAISKNLLAFYHECRPLIGYTTHVLFCDR